MNSDLLLITIAGMTLLKHLHDGIFLGKFRVTIPWLITERELFHIVPETEFTRSAANWPMLQCPVLGTPNCDNRPESRLHWQDDWVCVVNSMTTRQESGGSEVPWHSLVIYAHSTNPDTFAYQRGRSPDDWD